MSNDSTSSKSSRTDWQRLKNQRDADIDFSDIPEVGVEAFGRAVARQGLEPLAGKKQVTLRIDANVLDWFRAQGRGYQTRINQLLGAYFDAHQDQKRR